MAEGTRDIVGRLWVGEPLVFVWSPAFVAPRVWYDETTAITSTQWDDKSGNNRHSTMSIGTLSTSTINGRRVTAYSSAISSTAYSSTTVREYWIVVQYDAASPDGDPICCGGGSGNNQVVFRTSAGEAGGVYGRQMGVQCTGYAQINLPTSVHGRLMLLRTRFDVSATTMWHNGSLITSTGGCVTGTDPGRSTLGGGYGSGSTSFIGNIAEFLVTDSLSTDSAAALTTYLMNKWEIV